MDTRNAAAKDQGSPVLVLEKPSLRSGSYVSAGCVAPVFNDY